jgi:hypothetical protein
MSAADEWELPQLKFRSPNGSSNDEARGGHEFMVRRKLSDTGKALCATLDIRPSDNPLAIDEELSFQLAECRFCLSLIDDGGLKPIEVV